MDKWPSTPLHLIRHHLSARLGLYFTRLAEASHKQPQMPLGKKCQPPVRGNFRSNSKHEACLVIPPELPQLGT
eukprot:2096554-Amphidinium_carterae.1